MIGVVADDISGAAELGAMGLRFGLRAELLTAGPVSSGAELVCIDSDSRSCPPEEAGRRAALAAQQLRAAGAEWIYKKVDSVLRGQVVAEVRAIQQQLGAARTLLSPANPGLGRTVRGGQYFVRGSPLHETDFRFDPEFPREVSAVLELLADGGEAEVRMCRPGEPLPAVDIVVAEVANADDVRHWATRLDSATLPAGAAEFFGAILEARGLNRIQAPKAAPVETGPELFVCGSTSGSTRQFLATARSRGVPVLGLSRDLACSPEGDMAESERLANLIVRELGAHPRVVLALDLPPMGRAIGPRMAMRLAEVALAALAQVPNARVFAEGGATAACLVRCAGWQRLEVVREYAQGVVGTIAPGQPARRFTLKPGSYVWPAEVEG